MRIFTIGHSTRTADELLALLRAHGIRRLVDVRRYPGSRRHPQFSRELLSAQLAAAGIEYVHATELGGRRSAQPESANDAWRSTAFRGYADHMASAEFQAWLERLITWAAGSDTAIMCAEAVPWRCHRQLIADALVARRVGVTHIASATRAEAHSLSPHAVVSAAGGVTYPANPPETQIGLFADEEGQSR
jgi:uncharacterized protein (DUF488 family)